MSAADVPATTAAPKQLRRAALASSIGTLLEYYDYYLYGLAASTVFPKVFFPSDNATLSQIVSFLSFGIGFVLRPLGGVIIGHFGDRHGRKPALILTVSLMGASTFIIGILPSHATAGILAPILLIAMRLVQGFSVGGEMGGATSLAVEYAPRNRRGLYGSLLISGAGFALLISSGLMAWVSSTDAFLVWTWRIPFLLSAVLLVAGLIIRSKIEETPVFARELAEERELADRAGERRRSPIMQVLRQPRAALLVILIGVGSGTAGYAIITFGPSYLKDLGLSATVGSLGLVITGAFEIVLAPVWGLMSDRFGRRPMYIAGCVGAIVTSYPVFLLFNTKNPVLIWIAMTIGYSVFCVILSALAQTMMSEAFDTSSRYTGISVGYQFCGLITGWAPVIGTALTKVGGGNPWLVSVYVGISCVVSIIATVLLPEGRDRELSEDLAPERVTTVSAA